MKTNQHIELLAEEAELAGGVQPLLQKIVDLGGDDIKEAIELLATLTQA